MSAMVRSVVSRCAQVSAEVSRMVCMVSSFPLAGRGASAEDVCAGSAVTGKGRVALPFVRRGRRAPRYARGSRGRFGRIFGPEEVTGVLGHTGRSVSAFGRSVRQA
ncbi:hypothetical protein GCM10010221_00520 [Streptomyces parvus]|nr:hypothetical protein GCM10010221_00520 [Streptomyces parvus]